MDGGAAGGGEIPERWLMRVPGPSACLPLCLVCVLVSRKVGTSVSILTFIALVVMIWVHYQNPPRTVIVSGVINAFIIAVTIIVVAIPEGLPLAVTMCVPRTQRSGQHSCRIAGCLMCLPVGGFSSVESKGGG